MELEQAMVMAETSSSFRPMAIAATTLAAEVRRLREATKHMTTIDGAIVMPTDAVWVAGQSRASKFYVAHDWTIPLAVRDDASDWHDLPVTECYSTEAAAEAARWQT